MSQDKFLEKIAQLLDSRLLESENKTQQQFKAINKRFDEMNKRFNAINTHFDAIDKRFEGIDKKFKSIDQRFEELEMKMELRFQAIDKRFQTIEETLQTIKKQQDEDRADWITFFHESGRFFDVMQGKVITRIERIESHLNV